jgi:Lrp/AsnC family transcriptional regulator, leucine-responsive regulatory protein
MTTTLADLDATDFRLLELLQQNAALTNKTLAEHAHISPATCLRRIKALTDAGFIAQRVAILSPEKLGGILFAVVEITLDEQTEEQFNAYAAFVASDGAVQQCYRVSGGADFILFLQIPNMDAYHHAAHRLFAANTNVRNIRTFFSIRRIKYSSHLDLPQPKHR